MGSAAPGSWPAEGAACWAWSGSTSPTTWGLPTARRASSAWPTPNTLLRAAAPARVRPVARNRGTAGERLLHITGALDAGPADDWVFQGSKLSCEEHGLPHEILTGAEVNRRFPGYRLPEDIMAVFQTDGGYLLPERCSLAHVEAAQEEGAEIHGCEPVMDWTSDGRGVTVKTAKSTYTAGRLVITAAPGSARW